MSAQQPKALQLANALGIIEVTAYGMRVCEQSSAELRRLHLVNAELIDALEWIVQYYRIEKLPNHMVSGYAKTAIAKAQE